MIARDRMGRSGPLLTTPPRLMGRLRLHQDRLRASPRTSDGSGAANLLARYGGLIRGAVNLAGRHFSDQIHQSRRAASEVLDGSYNVAAFDQDMKMCLDRMLRLPREVRAISLDFFDGITGAPVSCSGSPEVVVEVVSARRTEATVQLSPTSSGFVPLALPLFTADRAAAPITNARFVVKDGTRLVLTVRIPDSQPLGTYTAAIVDAQTQEPGGLITIKVLG
jgi:hypothetical protein